MSVTYGDICQLHMEICGQLLDKSFDTASVCTTRRIAIICIIITIIII